MTNQNNRGDECTLVLLPGLPVATDWVKASAYASDVVAVRINQDRIKTAAPARNEDDLRISTTRLRPGRFFWRANGRLAGRSLVDLVGQTRRRRQKSGACARSFLCRIGRAALPPRSKGNPVRGIGAFLSPHWIEPRTRDIASRTQTCSTRIRESGRRVAGVRVPFPGDPPTQASRQVHRHPQPRRHKPIQPGWGTGEVSHNHCCPTCRGETSGPASTGCCRGGPGGARGHFGHRR